MSEAEVEIEALTAIFHEDGELTITKRDESSYLLQRRICRATSEASVDISVLVEVLIDSNRYPQECSPEVSFRRARGLCEADVATLQTDLFNYLETQLGNPVLFEIFQRVQDSVDAMEGARGDCAICLAGLGEQGCGGVRAVEGCGHAFHRGCLGRHARLQAADARRQQALLPPHLRLHDYRREHTDMTPQCPICRCPIDHVEELLSEKEASVAANEPSGSSDAVELDLDAWRAKQSELSILFAKQQAQGGIIDVEEESRRLLVTDETRVPLRRVPTAPAAISLDACATEEPQTSGQSAATSQTASSEAAPSLPTTSTRGRPHRGRFNRRGGGGGRPPRQPYANSMYLNSNCAGKSAGPGTTEKRARGRGRRSRPPQRSPFEAAVVNPHE